MPDDIQLTKCQRPQLAVKSGKCSRCGTPTLGVGNLCVACMNSGWKKEMLAGQGAILKGHPASLALEIARDKGQRRHVALIGFPGQAFCGMQLTESRKKRMRAPLEGLPPGVCPLCLETIDQVIQEAAQ